MIIKFDIFENTKFHSMKQIDDIIDKISMNGYESLDDSEKAILNNFSKDDEDINTILVEISELELKSKILQNKIKNEIFDDLKQKYLEKWIKITSRLTSLNHQLEHVYKVDKHDIWAYQDKNGLLLNNDDNDDNDYNDYNDYGDENENINYIEQNIEKQEIVDFIIDELKNVFNKNYLRNLLNKIPFSFLLHELSEEDWILYEDKTKYELISKLIIDLLSDHYNGDYTVLDELLFSIDKNDLIKSLNKNKNWEKYLLNKTINKYNL